MSTKTPLQHSFGATATRGVTLMSTANFAAKLLGIGTLYVTGLLLSPEDFALYAIAIAWGELFEFLRNGGMQKILIYRGKSFRHLYAPLCGLSFVINIALCAMVMAIAPFVAAGYESSKLIPLIMIIGVSIPAGTVPILLRAELSIDLRFGEISILNVYAALLRNASIIALAFLEFGPFSLAWPFVLVMLFEWAYLIRRSRVDWRPSLPNVRLFWATVRQSAWIIPGLAAMAMASNGSYLVIGALENKTTTGLYFFGFQLSLAVFTMISQSLYAVFTPSFASLSDHPARRDKAFVQSIEMSAFVIFFLGFGIAAVAQPTVGWVWSGKWDAAIPVVEIIAVTAVRLSVTTTVRSLLEARGIWKAGTLLSVTDAVGLMVSSAIGALMGGLIEIAIAVGAYSLIGGVIYVVVASRYVSVSLGTVLKAVFWPYLIGIAALAGAWGLTIVLPAFGHAAIEAFVKGTMYVALFGLCAFILKRELCMTAFGMLWRIVRRR